MEWSGTPLLSKVHGCERADNGTDPQALFEVAETLDAFDSGTQRDRHPADGVGLGKAKMRILGRLPIDD